MENRNIFILIIIISLGFVFAQDHSAGRVPSAIANQMVQNNDNLTDNALNKPLGINAVVGYGYEGISGNTVSIGIPDGALTTLAAWVPGGFASSACRGGDGNYYITDVSPALYQLDPATGLVTPLGVITGLGSDSPNGIAFNPANGMYYIAAGIIGTSDNIYSLDINTLVATLIGGTGTGGLQIDFCISGNGICYSNDLITDNAYTINLATGVATLLGPTGYNANFGQGMSFDRQTNTIYLSAFNNDTFSAQLRTMDPVTGMTTLLVDWGVLYGGLQQIAPFALANPFHLSISGWVRDGDGNAVPDVDVTFSNGGATVKTDVNGKYITSVAYGWHGTSTANYDWWTFVPMSYDYSTPVTGNLTDQDFTATQLPFSVFIDGHILDKNNNGIEGVSISFDNGGPHVMSNMYGYYKAFFAYGWNGASNVSMDGKSFAPESMNYEPLTDNVLDQDYYVAGPAHLLMTGYVRDADGNGIDGAAVTFSNGGATVYTYPDGLYEGSVAAGWNGTATVSMLGYVFTPALYEYSMHLWEDQLDQDFTAAADPNLAGGTLDTFGDKSVIPAEFTILPAYPNPFNPTTTISYGLDSDSKVSVEIFDVSGKLISSLQNGHQSKGWHSITWNGTNNQNNQVPAGIYLSKITSNNTTKTTKLMLLK